MKKLSSEKKFYIYAYLDTRKPNNYKYGNYYFDYEPFYIGKGYGNRLYDHLNEKEETTYNQYKVRKIKKIQKIGLNPIIIKLFDNICEDFSLYLESEIIKTIGRYDKKEGPLLNLTDGGDGMSGYIMSEELKSIQRERNLGEKNAMFGKSLYSHWVEKDGIEIANLKLENYKKKFQKENLSSIKSVYQYDLNLIFIKEYKSLKDSANKNNYSINSIGDCCRGVQKNYKGYIWSYIYFKFDNIEDKLKEIEKHINKSKPKNPKYIYKVKKVLKSVYQYDLNLNFIKEYTKLSIAKKETGLNQIGDCCRGVQKQCGGYIWSYNFYKFETEEERLNESNKFKRNTISEERKKILSIQTTERNLKYGSDWNKGRKHSEETKKKQSESQKGSKNHQFGRVYSEEERINMSILVKEAKRIKKEEKIKNEQQNKITVT